jgi:hypothetical protein
MSKIIAPTKKFGDIKVSNEMFGLIMKCKAAVSSAAELIEDICYQGLNDNLSVKEIRYIVKEIFRDSYCDRQIRRLIPDKFKNNNMVRAELHYNFDVKMSGTETSQIQDQTKPREFADISLLTMSANLEPDSNPDPNPDLNPTPNPTPTPTNTISGEVKVEEKLTRAVQFNETTRQFEEVIWKPTRNYSEEYDNQPIKVKVLKENGQIATLEIPRKKIPEGVLGLSMYFLQCQECKMWDSIQNHGIGIISCFGVTRKEPIPLIPLDSNNNPYPDDDKVVSWVCKRCFRVRFGRGTDLK